MGTVKTSNSNDKRHVYKTCPRIGGEFKLSDIYIPEETFS